MEGNRGMDKNKIIGIFKASPTPTLVIKADVPDFTIIQANDAYLRLTSTREKDLIGKSLFDAFPENPDDPHANGEQNLRESFDEVMRTGKTHKLETLKFDIRVDGSDYQTKYWSPQNTPVLNNENEVEFIINTVYDITDRVLRERENKLVFDHTEESILLVDDRLKITHINSSFSANYKKYFGIEVKTGDSVLDYSQPERRNAVKKIYEQVLAGETIEDEITVPHKDRDITFNAQYKPAKDLLGHIYGVFVTLSDVTEEKSAKEKYQSLIQTIDGIVWESDIDSDHTNYVSPQIKAILGYEPGDWIVISGKWESLLHPDDRQETIDYCALQARMGNNHVTEYRIKKSDGEYLWIRDVVTVIKHQGQPVSLQGLMLDISEQKKSERKLSHMVRDLQERVKEQSCLYEISKLDHKEHTVEELLKQAVKIIPKGWQYPEITEVFITWNSKTFPSKNYRQTDWELHKKYNRQASGTLSISVVYTERVEKEDISPFLKEEEELLNVICDQLSLKIEQIVQQQVLETQRIYLQKVMTQSLDVICIVDAEGKFVKVSPAAQQVWGYKPEELEGRPYMDFVFEEDHAKTTAISARIMEGNPTSNFENRYVRKDGSLVPIIWAANWDEEDQLLFATARDARELKAAQAKSEFERRDKEALINSTDDLIWSVSKSLRLIAANEAFIKNIRKSVKVFITPGDSVLQGLDEFPEYKRTWETYYKRALSGESFRVETSQASEEITEKKWYETSFNPIFESNRIIGVACYSRDITEAIISRRKLEIAERKFRNVVEHSTNMFYTHDTEGVLSYVSPQSVDFLGCLPEEAMRRYTEFVTDHPVNLKGVETTQRAIDTGNIQPPYELQLKKDNGEIIWVEVNEAPYVKDGKTIQIVGCLTDITDRKIYEEQLQESLERYQFVNKATSDAIWDWDLQSDEIVWGDGFESIFGYKIRDLNKDSSSWSDRLHPNDKEWVIESIQKVIDGNENNWREEYRFERVDGSYAYVVDKGFVIRDNNGKAVRMIGALQDITENKELELLLEQAQRLARIGGWELDLTKSNEDVMYWSDMTKEILEVDDEYDPTLSGGFEFYDAKSKEIIQKAVENAIQNGIPFDCELKLITAKNNERWVRCIGEPELVDGVCTKLFGSFQDITDRKTSELRLKTISDNLPGAIFQYNLAPDGTDKIMYLSQGTFELWGLTAEQVMKDIDTIWSQFHEDDLEDVKTSIMKSAETLQPWFAQWRSKHPDGEIRWHEGRGTPTKLADDSILWDSMVIDITAEKEAELEAERSTKEKETILESIGDAFFAVDNEWTVTYWNKEAERFLDMPREDVLNKNLWDIYSDAVELDFYKNYHKAMDEQITVHFEEYYPTKEKWFEVSAYPSAHGLSVYFKNITERKVAEDQLKQLNEELTKHAEELAISNAELEQFAYVASHDLQEPLRMVSSFLTQLEKKYTDQLDDKGRQYINFAVDGAKRMRQIILDLLNYSRVGRIEYERKELCLNKLLKEVLKVEQGLIDETGAEVSWKELPKVSAAETPLQQVFQNLIGNALKYHAPDVRPEIIIKGEEKSTFWQFSVSDNGIGIKKEFQDSIFNIFQRLHTRDEYSGTGIGLAISKKIVERHEGKIWVESSEGKGSTFYFTIKKPKGFNG